VWLDPAATTKKALAWLAKTADQHVQLLAFPETVLSGCPSWVTLTDGTRFNDSRQKRAYAAYLDAAVEIDGPEVTGIVVAARDLRCRRWR
jgi:nitrilase